MIFGLRVPSGGDNSEGCVIQVAMLTGQTAVITGGARGLGLAIAERFVAEGARVVLGDVNLEETQVVAKQLGGDDVAVAVRCDVTQSSDVETLIQTAVERFGGLDIMVNNAGITRDATMRKMTEEQFDQVINVHLKGTWNGTRLAAAVMRENKRGAIINMSSVAGRFGYANRSPYSTAKWGLIGFTKTLSIELGGVGIRANAILPGAVDGPRIQRVFEGRAKVSGKPIEQIKAEAMAVQSLKRMVDPRDIAALAVFLASDAAKSISGQMLPIDNDMQQAS